MKQTNYHSIKAGMLRGMMLGGLLCLASPTLADFPSRLDPPLQSKFAVPDGRPCGIELKKTAYIAYAEWQRLGGPNGPMGCPTQTQTREGGRFEVLFENGAIVMSPVWQNGVLAAFQDGGGIVVDWAVDWFDLPGLNYDKFLVRWQGVGWGRAQQDDVYADMSSGQYVGLSYHPDTHLRTKGTHYLAPPAGSASEVYSVVVKGCDVAPWPAKDTCRQDWFGPVFVRYNSPARSLNDFGQIDLRPITGLGRISGFDTVAASRATQLSRASRAILQAACQRFLPWNVYRNEGNATLTAAAKLAYAEVFSSDRCPGRDIDNRKEVAEWLLRQKVESKAGTTNDTPPALRTGEYDVALKGWIVLLYAFGDALPNQVYLHVLQTLLNKRGPFDPADQWWGAVSVPIPETENHTLMIETSRYLTNQLLCERGLASLDICDNNRNGMNTFMLEYLHQFLTRDFIEYNAKPYQDYSITALFNLASYARDDRVKTAANMVLDYLFVKAAASSDSLRRSVPYRRRRSHDSAAFFEVPNYDPMVGFLAQLAGNTHLLGDWLHPFFAGEMVWAAISEYRIPPPVLDVILNRESRSFYQVFRHSTMEIYFGSPSYTISAGGTNPGPAYSVAGFSSKEDDGITVPTLFLPATRALRSRDEAPRFPTVLPDVGNLCVAPNFACGSAVLIPKYLGTPDQPPNRREGQWEFFNDGDRSSRLRPDQLSSVRGLDQSQPAPPGYYLAVYRGDGIAFLEAYDRAQKPQPLSFDQFVRGVIERSNGTTFDPLKTNRYMTTDGTVIEFSLGQTSLVPLIRIPTIVSINGKPPYPNLPGIASGSIADSEGMAGFFRIRNPNPKSDFAGCDLVLDDRDPLNPIRELKGPAMCPTGEKVATIEEYKPCNPVVFIPSADAPADRISQAWGDRGIWSQDRINVRIQESPKGSGQFDVQVREGSAIELTSMSLRMADRPTFQYRDPIYPISPTSVAGTGKIEAPKVYVAPGKGGLVRTSGGLSKTGGIGRPEENLVKSGVAGAESLMLAQRFERSLGLSLDKGIRLEVDVLCDERLSPRVYGLRYLRFGESGQVLVDVMLKFSQPPPH